MNRPDFSTTESSIKTLLQYYGYPNLRTVAEKNNITAADDKLLAITAYLFLLDLYGNDVQPN